MLRCARDDTLRGGGEVRPLLGRTSRAWLALGLAVGGEEVWPATTQRGGFGRVALDAVEQQGGVGHVPLVQAGDAADVGRRVGAVDTGELAHGVDALDPFAQVGYWHAYLAPVSVAGAWSAGSVVTRLHGTTRPLDCRERPQMNTSGRDRPPRAASAMSCRQDCL